MLYSLIINKIENQHKDIYLFYLIDLLRKNQVNK
jgi:hypothetical protein